MANAIGYEVINVGDRPVGPTAAIVKGGVACAVFYVDPDAPGPVHWVPTFPQRDSDGAALTDQDSTIIRVQPTRIFGFPLYPDRAITVAGEGTIRNTRFIRAGAGGGRRKVHALYFDKVDVVASDFVGATSLAAIEAVLLRLEAGNTALLAELQKHTTVLEQGVDC